jgi:hypothetical protein
MAVVSDLDLPSLVGTPIDAARAVVAAAGGVTRTVEPGGVVTADFRSDRVTLVVEDGRVRDVPVIG